MIASGDLGPVAEGGTGNSSVSNRSSEADLERFARSCVVSYAVVSLSFVTFLRRVVRKASSSARWVRISESCDVRLMRIVRAFLAIG